MCGIVGLAGPLESSTLRHKVEQMNSAQRHRGPDEDGQWVGSHLALAMTRLSIVDLKSGSQPMQTEGKENVLVFNGEIYNHNALRQDLEAAGHSFKTRSDTEVLLRILETQGKDGLQKLNGMFGLAFYNKGANSLFLARDRLGIKPLYYAFIEGVFYFASEIKAILQALPKKPDLNLASLNHYLSRRYVPGPETIWQGIYKLQPGHHLTLDLQTLTPQLGCYWDQTDFVSQPHDSNRNYAQEFEDLFLDSVNQRLVSADVDVGILLSGGLDSSAIGAGMALNGHKSLHTFSVAFDEGGEYSELAYAKQVSDHIKCHHHEVVIGQKEFLDFLPEFVHFTDEPLADLAAIPTYYVSKLARDKVKVVLSGEGSDEIFAGYDLDKIYRKFLLLKKLQHLPGFILRQLPFSMAQTLADHPYEDILKANPGYISTYFAGSEKQNLWQEKYHHHLTSSQEWLKNMYTQASSQSLLDQMQTTYVRSWLVEDLLMKADKMSMATSLELRVPFLDHRMVEWASQLPLEHKVGRFGQLTTKKILRDFAAKHLPASIINRPKRGFPVPANGWLQGNLQGWAKDMLLDSKKSISLNFFEKKAVEQTLGSSSRNSWLLIILEQWLRANYD